MKAIHQHGYGLPGDVLELRDIDKPTAKDDEVLVRTRAASVHPDVWHVVAGQPYVLRLMGAGLKKPKNPVPGTDVAGVVESVGKAVTRFQPGDEVFGESLRGFQWDNGGTYAEYVPVPEENLALKPPNVTFEQAATIPTSGIIVLFNLHHGELLKAGQKVLVNGAGGGVGSLAMQIAKALGAEVTGVDSTEKQEMVRSLGADHVIDYTQEDFTQREERYDLIVDIPGNHSFSKCRRALNPDGTYILIGHEDFGRMGGRWFGLIPRFLGLMAMTPFMSQLPKLKFSNPNKNEAMEILRKLIETGKIRPVVDRTYPLSDVTEAMRYMIEEQTQGRVVISI